MSHFTSIASLILLTVFFKHGLSTCPPKEDIFPCTCEFKVRSLSIYCGGIQSVEQLRKSISGFQSTAVPVSNFLLDNSKFEYLPHDLFQSLAPVKEISIFRCNLTRIGNLGEDQFKGLEESLQSLTISKSFDVNYPLAYISMGHLKKLSVLDVSDTQVEVVHNEWFKTGPISLTKVRFCRGKVRAVGFRALQNLVNLEVVDLSDNKISYIPRTALPEQASHLTELNLERNKLSSFEDDFFSNMPNLKIINLELNEFVTIEEKIWSPVWSQLQNVNIDFNYLICDSKIKWIYSYKEDLENKLVAMCYKPFHLMERELHSLKPEELKSSVKLIAPMNKRIC